MLTEALNLHEAVKDIWNVTENAKVNIDKVLREVEVKAVRKAVIVMLMELYSEDIEVLKFDLAKLIVWGTDKGPAKRTVEYILWHLTTRYFDGDYAGVLKEVL